MTKHKTKKKKEKPEPSSSGQSEKPDKMSTKEKARSVYFCCDVNYQLHVETMEKFKAIEEVTLIYSHLHYLVRLDDESIGLVDGRKLRMSHPQDIIKFFESRTVFEKTAKSQEKKNDEVFEAYKRHMDLVAETPEVRVNPNEDEAEENDEFGLPKVSEIEAFEELPETSESSSGDEITFDF